MLNIIFTKDRPLQLTAHLESLMHNQRGLSEVVVSVHTMTPEYYDLRNLFQWVKWEQRPTGFDNTIRTRLTSTTHKTVQFSVDDSVWTNPWIPQKCEAALDNPAVDMVTLRSGRTADGRACWKAGSAGEIHRDYPFDISSSIHRVDDIRRAFSLSHLFEVPNDIEAQIVGQIHKDRRTRTIASTGIGCLITQDVNKVQHKHNPDGNGITSNLTAEHCIDLYRQGKRIDWLSMQGAEGILVGDRYWKLLE